MKRTSPSQLHQPVSQHIIGTYSGGESLETQM